VEDRFDWRDEDTSYEEESVKKENGLGAAGKKEEDAYE
jgi:hypothetical protein